MIITGRGAVVTGGATGIGRGIALALLKAGVKEMVIADVEGDRAEATAAELRDLGVAAHATKCDVRKSEAFEALADFAWERLEDPAILFNNAGVGVPGPAFEQSDEDILWQFQVNVFGVMNGCRSFGPRFIAGGRPSWICNTASHNGFGIPVPHLSVYVATKHAVVGYTDALRKEHPQQSLGFSLLCPGVVATEAWNAGRNRPAELGGRYSGQSEVQSFQENMGITAELAGQIAVAGVQNDEFFIWTHPFDIELVQSRGDEAKAAVERQWPEGALPVHKRLDASPE